MNRKRFILIGIIFLAVVVRLAYLHRIPNGFIPEEVSTGWNAYSLLKTGRDEWGVFLPLIFRETGGFKLALNSYLIVPVMALLGVNELAVRLPTAIAGILTVYLTYALTRKLFKNTSYALAAALLVAISPWHVAVGRYAVDVNWGIPLFLLGLILLLKSQKQVRWLMVAAVCFGLTYYTYFNYVVFTFLFLICYFLWNRRMWWIAGKRKWVIVVFVIQLIFLSPYILQLNLTIRFRQATQVSQIGFTNRTNEHREACEKYYAPLFCRGVYNKYTDRALELTRNYINHYSTTVYFLYGSQLGLSGMPDRWGLMYVFEFGLLLVGLVVLIKKQLFHPILVLWFFLYGVPSSLAAEAHIWRMLTLVPLPQIVAGVGLVTIGNLIKKSQIRIPLYAGLVGSMSFLVLRFFTDYTGYFPYNQGMYSYFGFRDLYEYLQTIEKKYDYIVVAPTGLGFEQLYIYYLFYTRPDPRQYQNGIDVERAANQDGWVTVKRVGKWHFEGDVRNVVFSLPDKTLLITDGSFKEKEPLPKKVMTATLIHTIDYPNGDTAFKIMELYKNPQPDMVAPSR